MPDEKETTPVWVNPLVFLSLDSLIRKVTGAEGAVNANSLLADLVSSRERTPDPVGLISRRYDEVSEFDRLLPVVPADDTILAKIVWPLRSAKQAYILGDSLGCIALSGSVGEMVATFVFELTGLQVGGKALAPTPQKRLFGKRFEALGQSRRVDVLRTLGVWAEPEVTKAKNLAWIRNRYVHGLSEGMAGIQHEAFQAYRLAAELTSWAIGPKFVEGAVVWPGPLLRYIRRQNETGPEGAGPSPPQSP